MATYPTVVTSGMPVGTAQLSASRTVIPAAAPMVVSSGMPTVPTGSFVSMNPPVQGSRVVYVQQPGAAPGPPAMATSTGIPRVISTAAPVVTTAAPVTTLRSPQVLTAPAQVTYVQSAAPRVVQAAPLAPSVRTIQTAPTVTATTVQAPRPNTLAGPAYTQGAYEAKHHDDPQLQNLKELRKTSGLKQIPVDEGLQFLKASAVDGKLSREQFLGAYTALLKARGLDPPTEVVQHAVFDLFDRDENNVVDMMELICGISLLCSGSEDDKIHAVFNVFDENGDGFISMDEMFKFLTSVFKVVLTPNVMAVMNSMGVTVESPEDLASVTSLECFKTADLNHDGKLSVTEFKNWFYAPRNDPSFLFSPVRKLLQ